MDKKALDFTVYCIESVAEHLNLKGNEVYGLLSEKSDILDQYIIPSYDALHTQGQLYIVNDIVELMRERGAITAQT